MKNMRTFLFCKKIIFFCAAFFYLCISAQAVEFYDRDSQQVQPSDTEGGSDTTVVLQGDLNLTPEQLMIVQRALRESGYLCMVTGVFGKNTYRELIRYQRKMGLPPTGMIDKLTLISLGIYDKVFGLQQTDKGKNKSEE